MNDGGRIFVAGHRGLVGSAIVRELGRQGFANLLLRGSEELDLRNQAAVERISPGRAAGATSFWRRPRLEASTLTTHIRRTSSATTCRFRRT